MGISEPIHTHINNMPTSDDPVMPVEGDVVVLQGLKGRADLNGTKAVVLKAETPEEEATLKEKGRLKVTAFPKPISIKFANVRHFDPETDAYDWTIYDLPEGSPPAPYPDTLKECLTSSKSQFSVIDSCDQLSDIVFKILGGASGTEPGQTLAIDEKFLDAASNNTASYNIYFCQLDAIGHHFILETNGGVSRIYQSFVKDTEDLQIGPDEKLTVKTGYTVGEWTRKAPKDQKKINPSFKQAKLAWGCGKDLSRQDVVTFIETLLKIQTLSDQITEVIYQQIPAAVREANDQQVADAKANAKIVVQAFPLLEWANNITSKISEEAGQIMMSVPGVVEGAACTVASRPEYEGEPFMFNVPEELGVPFNKLCRSMFGSSAKGYMFIKMLAYRNWRNMRIPWPQVDGEFNTIGWAFHCATIPH